MTTADMRHAFISFSSKDEKQARALCDDMEKRGVGCWISARDVRPGRNYQTEIIEAIRSADNLLLVFSTNAGKSEEVSRELSLASKHQLRICPVRIEDVQPTGGMEFMLATSQWVDAFRDWDGAMDRLAGAIGGAAITLAGDPDERTPWKTWAVAAGGVAVVLAVSAYFVARPIAPKQIPVRPTITMTAPLPIAATPAGPPKPDSVAIEANVESLAAGLDCAGVLVESHGADAISLSGFVKSAADEQRLVAAANPLRLQNDLDVEAWPFCAVRAFGPSLGATDDIDIELNRSDGRYQIGDNFYGSLTVGHTAKPTWVQLVLVDVTGAITVLLPAPGQFRMANPGERVSFGAATGQLGQLTALEPTGRQVLLAIASDRQPAPPAGTDDTARIYLPKLHDALAKLGGQIWISSKDLQIVRQR